MKNYIESFVNLAFLFVVLENSMIYFLSTFRRMKLKRDQKLLHFLYLFTLLFLVSHQIKLLQTVYQEKMWDLQDKPINFKLKGLQYIGESSINACIIMTLHSFIGSFELLKYEKIKDKRAFKTSSILYNFLRAIPLVYFLFGIFQDLALFTFMTEVFLIGESIMLVLVFMNIKNTLKRLEKQYDSCLMVDKSYVDYILSKYQYFSASFIISIGLQAFYKILYLSIIINQGSASLQFVKDVSNLVKIISTGLIMKNINEIIVLNETSHESECKEDIDEKFFKFEEAEVK